MSGDGKLLLKVPEVALRLGLGESTVYAKLALGEIRSVKIGRSRRVKLEDLEAYVAGLGEPEPAPVVPLRRRLG